MIINFNRRSFCAAVMIFAVLAANILVAPTARAVAPAPQPNQKVSIEVFENMTTQFDARSASVQGLTGNTLNIFAFGRAYSVDITSADLVDLAGNPVAKTAIASASKVNVYGTISAGNSSSVSGRRVQILLTGPTVPTGNPTGCTVKVISNTPTNWLIGGPQADHKFILSPNYPIFTAAATHTTDTSGNLLPPGIYNIQIPQDPGGWINPVITPGINQMCPAGSSITFNLGYTDPNGVVPGPTSAPQPSTTSGDDSVARLMNALYEHARTGRNMSDVQDVQEELWGDSIENWNNSGGSQNLALVAEAATGDYKFFEDLANFSKTSKGGIFNLELGSPGFYFTAPIAAFVVALSDARKAGDTAAADAISGYLRATWALWSLVTVPANRSSGWLNLNGTIQTSASGGGSFMRTPSVAVAGERWLTEYGGLQTELWRDEVSSFLSWALDLSRSESNSFNGGPLSANQDAYADTIIAVSIGVSNTRQSTPAKAWGLSDSDREMFASIINGNRSRLGSVLDIIKEYGVYNHLVRMRRTSNGVETIFFKSLNGNKPTHAATIVTNDGEWKGIRPCYFNSNSNPGYYVSVADGTITAGGDSSNCATVSMPELDGTLIYSVVLSGKSATEGNVTNTSGSSNAPPTPPGAPTPPNPPGSINTSTSTPQSDRVHYLINDLKQLRKDTKALGFSTKPHDKPKILYNLTLMQIKIIELFTAVTPFMGNANTALAMGKVQPAFTAFNVAAIACTSPTAYVPFVHVSEMCKRGLERTTTLFNDAMDSLRRSLPPPSPAVPPDSGDGDSPNPNENGTEPIRLTP